MALSFGCCFRRDFSHFESSINESLQNVISTKALLSLEGRSIRREVANGAKF